MGNRPNSHFWSLIPFPLPMYDSNSKQYIQFTCIFAILLIFIVVSAAWYSTGFPPLNYYVWLVQLNTSGPRRVVQVCYFVLQVQECVFQIFTVTGDNSDTLEENLSGSETVEASTPGEINRQSSVIIIQTPAAVNGYVYKICT